MKNERWQKIEEIFEKIIELPKDEREVYLAQMCNGDDEMRLEIEEMIAADEQSDDFIESPIVDSNTLSNLLPNIEDSVPPHFIGRRIGAYQLIRELGRGGMGAVFLAERADEEFKKEVAIKLIKRGMDTDFILKRFRNERQILATLDHPNIARLLDGGTTPEGLPYFVMEYIEGEPIQHFCDARRLSIRERLELFQKVCSAVNYAHQNLIIHRDLKPGNILVTNDVAPKLLDFGIAKILNTEIAGDSLAQTQTGMRLMTPEYASPEQIRGEPLTPASDIYSLGVLLYEILTGRRPYRFPSRAPHDIARVICEEEPENPATVLTQNGLGNSRTTLETLSRNRQTTPEILKRELSGSLQNILLKTLRKSPNNRYPTAEDFSKDIQAFLDGQPISVPEFLHSSDDSFENSFSQSESLAVLPFRQLSFKTSSDSHDTGDFLSLGLADALITRLSNLRTVSVRPTSAILHYARTDTFVPENAGRELNVTYILDGRIQQVGKRVRVTTQLIQVRNNQTVWAAHFEEKSDDILSLQDSIAAQVFGALVKQLTGEENELIEKRGTNSAKAYEAYLRGRFHWHGYTVEGLAKALVCFYEAIAIDPNFARAYSGVADYFNTLSVFGIMPPTESFPAAKEAALKAVELDENLAEAYISLGITAFGYEWDFAESERHFKRALELSPNYSEAHLWYAHLLSLTGRHEPALKEMRRAESLNPQSPSLLISYAFTLRNAQRFEEALEKIRRALTIQPNYYIAAQGYSWVVKFLENYDEAEKFCEQAVELTEGLDMPLYAYGYVLAAGGKREKALQILAELEARREKHYVPPIYFVQIYTVLGEIDLAFEWLDKCFEERDFWAAWLPVDPRLEDLKKDSRYDYYLRKIRPLNNSEDIHESRVPTRIMPTVIETKPAPDKPILTSARRENMWLYAVLSSAVILIFLTGFWFLSQPRNDGNSTEKTALARTNPRQKAIAVLPFKTDSHLEDENSLGVGLAESLYRKLGQVKELSVRPAMLNLDEEQTPRQLGESFGVAYILQGTLEKSAESFQVSAELIDTVTEKILWAERFDEKISDFPTLQVAISERVLNALRIQLTANERKQLDKSYTENSEAYQLYLVGRYLMASRSPENLNKSIKSFEQARDKDPNFPLAYVGLADAYALQNLYQVPPPPDAYAKAKENALKALELDENLAEAHASIGYVLFYGDWERTEAERHFRRALELNPSYSRAHHWFALALSAMGRHDEAIEQIKIATEAEPRSAIAFSAAGLIYYYPLRFDEALEACRKSLAIDPGFVPAHKTMRVIYEKLGNYEEALAAYQKERNFRGNTDENHPGWAMITAQVNAVGGKRQEAFVALQKSLNSTIVTDNPKAYSYEIAIAYALLGDTENALKWLEKAKSARDHSFNIILIDPRLDKVRSDPRFNELIRNTFR